MRMINQKLGKKILNNIVKKFLISFFLIINISFAANHYVREGANGNGTDWNNAFGQLPSTLIRGDTYYIADGNYPDYTFDDPVYGTTFIIVRKATKGDHGTDVGWNDSYGDGVANWGLLKFKGSYYIFDGVTGGGPGSWTSGYGFKISRNDNVIFVMFSDKYGGPSDRIDVSDIIIRHIELEGKSPVEPGWGSGFNATASGAKTSNVTISYCYTHDIGDPHFYWQGAKNIIVEYCYITRNASSPEHHGVGFRMDECSDITFRYNMMSDMTGTGFFGGYTGTISNVSIYGNVFYHTLGYPNSFGNGVIYTVDSGLPTVIDWSIHNNSFVNLNNSRMIYFAKAGSGIVAYNNLFYLKDKPSFTNVNHDYSWFYPSFSHDESNGQVGNENPFVNWQYDNFNLKIATNSGIVLTLPYNMDMFGNIRGADGVWDRGAIEYNNDIGGNLQERILIYPNPVNFKKSSTVKLANLPINSIITIYDVMGKIITTLSSTKVSGKSTYSGGTIAEWDGRDEHGGIVSRGVYYCIAEGNGIKRKGKIAVIDK